MGYGVSKAKGTFLPRAHTLPFSLGPRIPCPSGPELDSQAFYLPNSFLDPKSVQRQAVSGRRGVHGGELAGRCVHTQVYEDSVCRMEPGVEREGGSLRARSQRLARSVPPYSDMKLQGLQEF